MSRPILAVMLALALAGCASPYTQALNSQELMRPEPFPTAADERALEPYKNSTLFPN